MDVRRELERLLGQVPPGRVVSFGTLARALGDVGASRAVARILAGSGVRGPLHRVVKGDGGVVTPAAGRTLKDEGIEVVRGRAPREAQLLPDDLSCRPVLRELRGEQQRLKRLLRTRDVPVRAETVGGVDLAYPPRGATAACVVMKADASEVLETVHAAVDDPFPYIPGYLAYREGEGVHRALEELSEPPDVLLLDGHGTLHPEGFGLACHVGVVEGLRTVGVAKSLLVGRLKSRPREALEASEVRVGGDVEGYAVRPPTSKRLVYVSPGHRIGVQSALRVVRRLLLRSYPEPLRLAHNAASAERRKVDR